MHVFINHTFILIFFKLDRPLVNVCLYCYEKRSLSILLNISFYRTVLMTKVASDSEP